MSTVARALRPAARRLRVTAPAPTTRAAAPLMIRRCFADKPPVYTESAVNSELGVGEFEGIKFRVEPLRRQGEDERTMRARLLCEYLSLVFFLHSTSVEQMMKRKKTKLCRK